MPQPNHQKCHTDCNNICRLCTKRPVNTPTLRSVYITNFQNFQVVHTSNQCCYLSYCNWNLQSRVLTSPYNPSLPLKTIKRWQPSLRSHKHSPCKGCCSRTLILSFQIPNKLWSSCFNRRLLWTSHWMQNQSPNTQVHQNVNEHMCPQSTNCRSPSSTLRHLLQSHMSNTTICQQTFQA